MQQSITKQQQKSLEDKIYNSLMQGDDMGLGETAEARICAEERVKEWMEENGITVGDSAKDSSIGELDGWKVSFARWADNGPIVGFVVRDNNKRDVCSLNVTTETIIFSGGDLKPLEGTYFSQQEAKEISSLIASAPALKEENERLKKEKNILLDTLKEITQMAKQWSTKGLTPTIFKAENIIESTTK